jgi:hypothetical protein
MPLTIDFESIFQKLGLPTRKRYELYKCPFCGHMSFKVYDDARAYCHTETCKWSGSATNLYAEVKGMEQKDALLELTGLYKAGKIIKRKRTPAEARTALAKDLKFLAHCRMHFAFYGDKRENQTALQRQSDISKGQFSKVLNWRPGDPSAESWDKVVVFLRSKINLKQLWKDLDDDAYFLRIVDEDLKEYIEKFR